MKSTRKLKSGMESLSDRVLAVGLAIGDVELPVELPGEIELIGGTTVLDGEIKALGESGIYEITIEEATTLRISLVGHGNLDTYIRIRDQFGQIIAEADDPVIDSVNGASPAGGFTVGTDAEIGINLLPGAYTILAEAAGHADKGNFSLHVTLEESTGDSPVEIQPIESEDEVGLCVIGIDSPCNGEEWDQNHEELWTQEENWRWTNEDIPCDVNNDGFESAIDALMVINFLNSGQSIEDLDEAHGMVDVNGDHFVSPIDALTVINALNSSAFV